MNQKLICFGGTILSTVMMPVKSMNNNNNHRQVIIPRASKGKLNKIQIKAIFRLKY